VEIKSALILLMHGTNMKTEVFFGFYEKATRLGKYPTIYQCPLLRNQ
jgi:hypothetical protein